MNRLDYQAIRRRISIGSVLKLLSYQAADQCNSQWRGPCPICSQDAGTAMDRCFSVNADRNLFRCFRCGRSGNQLDLWAHVTGRSLYPATLQLCRRLGITPIKFDNPQPQNGR